MISKDTIDKVYETARLEEVIGDFVQLKKSGANYKGLSPFTDERSPSFVVSPVKQIWKDFSSGKGGNVVAFLMEREHYTYPEAIKYLARKYNIEIEETEQTNEQKEKADERESMYLVSEYASDHFQDVLWNSGPGKAIGLSYFKERGFTDETIKKFGLGYALDDWSAFTDAALSKGYQLEFLEKTGLSIVKENKKFDRFKGRVLFPIQSMSGRVLGFGGRILTTNKKAAKYLNSPESDIYHKSKVLYGLYFAKQAIAKEDNCYLVEGYTDVIQMYQSGIHNVVSSSGTALTSDQVRLIGRLSSNITVLFDGDAAGLRASIKGIDIILEQGLNVRVCSFPEGEDPDSFSRKNDLQSLVAYLEENAKDFIQFKASVLVKEASNDPIKKADTIRDIVNSISKIPDRIKKEVYIKECARIMDISEAVLFNTLAQIGKKTESEAEKRDREEQEYLAHQDQELGLVQEEKKDNKQDQLYVFERKIIELLLLKGSMLLEFEEFVLKENEDGDLELLPEKHEVRVYEKIYLSLQEDEIELANDNFKQIYHKLIQSLNENDDFAVSQFMNTISQDLAAEVSSISMDDEKYELHDWGRKDIFVNDKNAPKIIVRLVSETILSLRCLLINRRVLELQNGTKETTENVDVMEEIFQYYQLRKLLSEKLYRVLA